MTMLTMTIDLTDADAEKMLNAIETDAALARNRAEDKFQTSTNRAYWAERATEMDALVTRFEDAREAALTAIGAR